MKKLLGSPVNLVGLRIYIDSVICPPPRSDDIMSRKRTCMQIKSIYAPTTKLVIQPVLSGSQPRVQPQPQHWHRCTPWRGSALPLTFSASANAALRDPTSIKHRYCFAPCLSTRRLISCEE